MHYGMIYAADTVEIECLMEGMCIMCSMSVDLVPACNDACVSVFGGQHQ